MPEAKTVRHADEPMLPYLLTPLLLLGLCAGLIVLVWCFAPTHQIQKYLNIAFMDNLKTTSTTAGLHIIEQDIPQDDSKTGFETGKIVYPKFGEQAAVLTCDAIGLNVSVFFGSNSELLAKGACMSTQSAVPGTGGNTVIDAHVKTFFSGLSDMKPGDQVMLYTAYGRFGYEAEEAIRFKKNDKKYLQDTDEDCLTLYTCEPQVLGSAEMRTGMRLKLISSQFYETE
ncbi:MAG: class D sortase [Oscillospiraceae bacterium]|nr:class D sortase [Oscillospiraceae bacterium]